MEAPPIQQAIVDSIPVMIEVYDGSGNLLLLNGEFTRILGWTLEEARKVDLTAECFPDPAERREVLKFMADDSPGWRDFKARARDGRMIRTSWEKVRLPDGSLIRIGIDATERERMDEETAAYRAHQEQLLERKISDLKGSEARFRRLLDSLPDWIWEVDPNGVYTYSSSGIRAILGYEPEEVIGKTPFDLMPPDEASRVSGIFESFKARAEPFSGIDNVNRRKDGRLVALETCGVPFFGDDGALLGFRGVDRDVSERKAAEKMLQESEERFRSLAEQLPLPVYETDERGRIAYMNRHGMNLFRYPEEEFRDGLTILDLIGSEDRERATETFRKRVTEGYARPEEYMWIRKDGTVFPAIACSAPFQRNGLVAGVAGMLLDMSDLRRAETELMGSRKYEAVGRLAGGIAHHLNNLMTVVAGYGTLIVERMDMRDPWRRQVEEMRRAGERAAALTAQLLAYSRRQILRPERIDLERFLGEIEGDVRGAAGPGVEVSVLPEPGTGSVHVDPEVLRNAVLRLVDNSRDAMPEGGTVTVLARRVDVSDDAGPPVPAGKYAMISVTDTGIGMEPETLSRLFEPFFTTKESMQVAGLSLPSVYGFVKQSKGYIFAESEPGKGTAVSIYLALIGT